jgi:hypothetical protein
MIIIKRDLKACLPIDTARALIMLDLEILRDRDVDILKLLSNFATILD